MPHPLTQLQVHTVRKPARVSAHEITADVCVVGAGVAGVSAAIESAKLGRDVVLIDSLPVLGGQMVNSLIGLFCGVFGNAPEYRQLTHGIFDEIFADLGPTGDLHFNRRHTITVAYDEVVLGRWIEERIRRLGIRVVLGAVIQRVEVHEGRIESVSFASRYGDVAVRATGFVDSTGDAALAWEAGLPCRIPERTIYGSQQIVLEHLDETYQPEPKELAERVDEKAGEYGLMRHDGLAFFFPGRNTAVMNMTHIEAPLDPVEASNAQLEGRAQADRVVQFLRTEYPKAFGEAKVRAYGFPGRRQTRWLAAVHQLTLDDVRTGHRFEDSVARTSWPIELHDRPEGYVWELFEADHVHYVPLRSMLPPGTHNLVAAGRCVDGDAAALSSIRVMGPCAAMGAGAAHALDLAGKESVHEVDSAELHDRLAANLD
ncbi:FAD-dependent oxidoreductase [Amycolatopsis alkalitolerans]|uniref:FAD-dependent oxidoreductase n=1 Tax=Amycolatopsis alkalitolerans TaxID=2547244 RepID=A0A5C4LXK1_9PSEU|nr:FAD-dependent oxidoreductase [Amycolatopsis alkalitolerans]TNC23336.1 FAD-dependent oxidoreductase [Amycolatopsis alkalitolerans]